MRPFCAKWHMYVLCIDHRGGKVDKKVQGCLKFRGTGRFWSDRDEWSHLNSTKNTHPLNEEMAKIIKLQ